MSNNSDNTLSDSMSELTNQIYNLKEVVNNVKIKEGENYAKLENILNILEMLKKQLNIKDDEEEAVIKFCKGRFVSGRYKGNRCTARALTGEDYCGKHISGGKMGLHLRNKKISPIKEEKKEEKYPGSDGNRHYLEDEER